MCPLRSRRVQVWQCCEALHVYQLSPGHVHVTMHSSSHARTCSKPRSKAQSLTALLDAPQYITSHHITSHHTYRCTALLHNRATRPSPCPLPLPRLQASGLCARCSSCSATAALRQCWQLLTLPSTSCRSPTPTRRHASCSSAPGGQQQADAAQAVPAAAARHAAQSPHGLLCVVLHALAARA